MGRVYMGQIMAECDCRCERCATIGYCQADRVNSLTVERDALKSKVAKQRNSNAALQRSLERAEATKRDHVFRLRQILIAALDGHQGWQISARRELGRDRNG